jgi:hypothetical protein
MSVTAKQSRYNREEMKCLTLHAHWAEAIFALGKDVENRSWSTPYRGSLAIHAGMLLDASICKTLGLDSATVKTGVILGMVDLVDCVRDSESRWAEPAMYHWLLRNPRRCAEPIPFRGQPGLFSVSKRIG